MILSGLPASPGSYALQLRLAQPVRLAVGRLGVFDFLAGEYLYLGSARGPGGLRARIQHHARIADRPHWHLDFLRSAASLLGGWYSTLPGALECAWSQALVTMPEVAVPVPGFGAADCRRGCPAHLVWFGVEMDRGAVRAVLNTPGELATGILPFLF